MRRFVVASAVAASMVGGGGASGFAGTPTLYAGAGLAQWAESHYDGTGAYPCETDYYQLDLIVALRTGGRQWEGQIKQTPFYGGARGRVPCDSSTPNSFPGEWMTGSFANPATGAVANASGTCAGYFGAGQLTLHLYCHLSIGGRANTLYLTVAGGEAANTGCASAGGGTGGEGCLYAAPIVGAHLQQS